MSSISIKGRVHRVMDTVQKSERFSTRMVVLETADNPKYVQYPSFECSGDRIALLDGVRVGDEVDIEANVNGREWKSPSGEVKNFTTLSVWKLKVTAKGAEKQPGEASDEIPF